MQAGEACDDGGRASDDGCSASCQWETDCKGRNGEGFVACGQTVEGSFSGAYSDVNGQCGFEFPYSQDRVFLFQTSAPQRVTLQAELVQPDTGFFVLTGSCHTRLCTQQHLGSGTLEFDALPGVKYYLVLEARSQQPRYSLTVSCAP